MTYLGIDISSKDFAAALLEPKQKPQFLGEFENSEDGFKKLQQQLTGKPAIIMEATGVYAEALAYYFHERDFPVYVEPPTLVKKAFQEKGKSDPIDSRQIAEYGYRFHDKLHRWTPKEAILENIRALLVAREHYVKTSTMLKNAIHAWRRKQHSPTVAIEMHTQQIQQLKVAADAIQKELTAQLNEHVVLNYHVTNLQTMPGVGFWLSVTFLDITDGFTNTNPRQIAAYLGICPYPHESGTSVKRRPKSDRMGSGRMRKLLFLVSLTMCKNNETMRTYFERRVAAGKPKRLVLNNIANKTIKIMCSMIEHGEEYQADSHRKRAEKKEKTSAQLDTSWCYQI